LKGTLRLILNLLCNTALEPGRIPRNAYRQNLVTTAGRVAYSSIEHSICRAEKGDTVIENVFDRDSHGVNIVEYAYMFVQEKRMFSVSRLSDSENMF